MSGRGPDGGPLVADEPPLFCRNCNHQLAWDFIDRHWVRAKDGSTCGCAPHNGGCVPREALDIDPK